MQTHRDGLCVLKPKRTDRNSVYWQLSDKVNNKFKEMVEKVSHGIRFPHSSLLWGCKDGVLGGAAQRILGRILCQNLWSTSAISTWDRKESQRKGIQEANKGVDSLGDPPITPEVTWGLSEGLGLILRWPERLQTQQASKQSWLHSGMSFPHTQTQNHDPTG